MKQIKFENPRQERIYRRLRLIGPGPASFYSDACILIRSEEPLDSTTHLVAHLLREIESSISAVLEMPEDREKRSKLNAQEKHRMKILNVLKALEISEDDQISQLWLHLTDNDERSLTSWVHRSALDRPRPIDEDFKNVFYDIERILDAILEHFENRYLQWFPILDELLSKQVPTASDLKILRNNVPNNSIALGYFFDRLKYPSWLKQLMRAGFFSRPPKPEQNMDGDSFSYPPWPQSHYLLEMSKIIPADVLEVLLEIPDTGNVQIYNELIDALLQMPSELSVQMVPKIKIWIEVPNLLFLPEKFALAIAHLAKGCQIKQALEVAQVLFKILQDPRIKSASKEELMYLQLEPCIRFDKWYYNQSLQKCLPDLLASAPEDTIRFLCDLLENSVKCHIKDDSESYDDSSYIWHQTIEEDDELGPRDVRNILISALRDSAESLMAWNGKLILTMIETYNYTVFKRIGLHLRRKYPTVDKVGTEKLITDAIIFNNPHVHHEYYHLLKEQFGGLPQASKENYFKLIETSFDIGEWIESKEKRTGTKPTREEGEKRARYWQYTCLYPISEYLDQNMQQKFSALQKEFGELEHPDFNYYIGRAFTGPTAPIKMEELQPMAIDVIVTYLQAWVPSGDSMSPSSEGLKRELQKLIALEPERFVNNAEKFQGLDSNYIDAFFSGIRDAVNQKKSIEWLPILNLCNWVLSQPRDTLDIQTNSSGYNLWGWTCKTIVDMLSAGLESSNGEIPFELRTNVWAVLKPITIDPDPTPEDEKRYGGSNMSPAELSINTTRGEAMHTVIRYALWIHRHTEKDIDSSAKVAHGFEAMPEVREVLEDHLDPTKDPSLAIRAVYGQWFPWLVIIDSDWTTRNINNLFPSDIALRNYLDAAWDAYITMNQPYNNVFELLKAEYHRAIERIELTPTNQSHRFNPDERLAEHLMTFYWQGKIQLMEPDGLLSKFYAKAPNTLRAYALFFIGMSLHNTKEAIPSQIIERLKALWTYRLNIAKERIIYPSETEEITTFWRWFNCEKLDEKWAIDQMLEVLKLGGHMRHDSMISKRLAVLSRKMPTESLACLKLIIEAEKNQWGIYSWRDDARTILENAIRFGNDTTKSNAIAVVHRLGAMGFLEFRDLLGYSK